MLFSLLALQAAVEPPTPSRLSVLPRCESGRAGEVVVCGERPDRFRLPLPVERDVPSAEDHRVATGAVALTPATRCGMFEGERRCGRREAELYGYGRGRDPITILSRLGTALLDPDADVSGPADEP